jgi:S-adenosylmethionine hydrolase
MLPIITLTSDWGSKDHYAAVVKGSLLSQLPEATIVDISHDITKFDIFQASFLVKTSYIHFPKGTIHILAINTLASINEPHTLVLYQGHYFIGADNGIFSLIFEEKPELIIELSVMQDSDYFIFSEKDIFVKAAVMIANGMNAEELGIKREQLNHKMSLTPIIETSSVKGTVIYVDSYENVFVNITEKIFKEIGKGRPFVISFRYNEIEKISESYSDVIEGDIVALFSTSGYLEIAQNAGNASSMLDLKVGDAVRVGFNEK